MKDFFKKFWKCITGMLVASAFAAEILAPSGGGIPLNTVQPKTRFDWQSASAAALEDKSQRGYDYKDFADPDVPGQRIKIQSSGLLHAFTDQGFQDLRTELPNYDFPEGLPVVTTGTKYYVRDLPDWGDARIEDGGKTVRVYDKKGTSVLRYASLISVPSGLAPFNLLDKNNIVTATALKDSDVPFGDTVTTAPYASPMTFTVEKGKLFAVPDVAPSKQDAIQLYDSTDTTAVNNKDCRLRQDDPTNNQVCTTGLLDDYIYDLTNAHYRQIIQWTLPAGSGSITKIAWFLYQLDEAGTDASTLTWEIHEVNAHTDWGESTATWNKYNGVNNWGTAGGDFSATVINSFTGVHSFVGWVEQDIQGGNSTNPLTLTWGNNADLIIKETSSHNPGKAIHFPTAEYTTDTAKRPYLEITYGSAAAGYSSKVNGVTPAQINGVVPVKINGI